MIKNWLMKHITSWLTVSMMPVNKNLSDFNYICSEISPADVLLIEGRDRISLFIQSVTQSAWSHAVIYIGCLNDITDKKIKNAIKKQYNGSPTAPLIVESLLGHGTIVRPLSVYEDEHIRICRPRGLQATDAEKIVKIVCSSLGSTYNVSHILALLVFLLPYRIIPKQWLAKVFNRYAKNSLEVICSAMIANAFNQVDFPILPHAELNDKKELNLIKRNASLYTPRDFDYSPFFAVVKYPIFSLSKRYDYHDLPWKNGTISNDHLGQHDLESSDQP